MIKTKMFISLSLLTFTVQASVKDNQCDFLWGTASAAYQVEGGWNTGGKGESNWDYFTHQGITKKIVGGEAQSGDVATNQISRDVYLKDIKLMKELGTNSYRFSISWARILPNGKTINNEGIEYYKLLINDLKDAGIKPIVTLYHWDMPLNLYQDGGWYNPNSVIWFQNYAKIVFDNFGKDVPYFITFNEPEGNIFTLTPLVTYLLNKTPSPYEKALSVESRAQQAIAMHHLLLANAEAVNYYHNSGLKGEVGISLNLSPCVDPENKNSLAAKKCNSLHNEWVLDALYKGAYPRDIEAIYRENSTNFNPTAEDMNKIKSGKPDFIGVNYYSPTLVKDDINKPFGIGERPNPDTVPSYNGPVLPQYLGTLLKELSMSYGKPEIIITENGAGFGSGDERLESGVILDPMRASYLDKHIDAVMKEKNNGVNIKGYLFWSLLDNFEWLWGYQNKFGLIGVDFNSPELNRTPKSSYYRYQAIIKDYKNSNNCNNNQTQN